MLRTLLYKSLSLGAATALAAALAAPASAAETAKNPCAKNPCATKPANPCAKNPCAKNPCAKKAANPCAKPANPCAKPANPCAGKPEIDAAAIRRPAGYKPAKGDAALGEKLWNDTKLSSNGMSCNTCHQQHAAFEASFAKPYPHTVAMAKDKAGVKSIHLDEMIQACLVMPMATKPLAWDSKELAALTAYTLSQQKTFKPGAKRAANPCAKNPCAKNPCAMKKAANPCAKNPCATKKPANPCAKM